MGNKCGIVTTNSVLWPKGYFWLYNDDERVTGLYGMFSQFTDEPKLYNLTERQIEIVLSNLQHKLDRLYADKKVRGEIPSVIAEAADPVKADAVFNQVRIYSTDGELVATYAIDKPKGTQIRKV